MEEDDKKTYTDQYEADRKIYKDALETYVLSRQANPLIL